MGMQLCRLTVGRLACHAGHPHSVGIVSTSALHARLVLQGELSQMNGIGRVGNGDLSCTYGRSQKKCHVVRIVCSLSELR